MLGTTVAAALYKPEIIEALGAAATGEKHVVWLQGAGCTGCTMSLLQTDDPDLAEAIEWFRLSIDFHPTIMVPAGNNALESLKGIKEGSVPLDVLIVEGAIPKGGYCLVGEEEGKPINFEEWVKSLGSRATYIIAVGTCAAFGGIPSARPNPTGCRSVKDVLPEKTVVNIPGCPPHPDWMLLTLGVVLLGHENWIELDELGRPKVFYYDYIHNNCQRRQFFENLTFAEKPSEDGCLYFLGCRGPITKSDCPNRLWNKGTSYCIISNAPCIGCTEKGFPDEPFAPFYEKIENPDCPPPVKPPATVDYDALRKESSQSSSNLLSGGLLRDATLAIAVAGIGATAGFLLGRRRKGPSKGEEAKSER